MSRVCAWLMAGLTAVAVFVSGGSAQAFPEKGKPITVLVPFSAGGTTDVSARLMAEFLEKELNTQFQIVNKPGATTQVANTYLVNAKPDGYTIILASLPSLAMTYLDKARKAPYTRSSFEPIAHYISGANLLAVQAGSRFKNVQDLIAAAKAKPKTVRLGTVGFMSNGHLPGVALEKATGAEFAFVHFKGAAPLVTALLAGDVDVAINGVQTTLPHARAGKMRAIGYFGSSRTAFLDDVPTLKEQGIDMTAPSSFAFLGPKGLPADAVETLTNSVKAILDKPEFQARLKQLGLESNYMAPGPLMDFWADFEAQRKVLIDLARKQQ